MRAIEYAIGFALVAVTLVAVEKLAACPFCNVESQTLSEETNGADAVVLAKLVKEAPATTDSNDPSSGMATFEIIELLKGPESLGQSKQIQVVFFGDSDRGKTYLVTGLGKDKIDWTTPLPLTETAISYVKQLPSIAPNGAERLKFFQDYLENPDPLLAQDAYDEFGRAPYQELIDLKSQIKHDKIVEWIADPEVSPSRRRLYLTMLGVCGTQADVPMLEAMIVSDFETLKPGLVGMVGTGMAMGGPVGLPAVIEAVQQDERRKKLGLDALVACYLLLRGPEGMDLVDERFLKNSRAEYTHIYSTIMALRFHGDENTKVIPRERLLASMRLLLENPDFADQVILDLSRWEDWSVLDQLVEMFKNSDEKGYVRQPVVSYLTVASEQQGDVATKAKAAIAQLEALDPETVKTARSLMAFGALGRARGAASSAGTTGAAATTSEATAATEATEKDDKASPDTKDSAVAAADTSQGFAASAADEQIDASQIPEPAGFVKEEPVGTSAGSDPPARAEANIAPAPSGTQVTVAKVATPEAGSAPADQTAPQQASKTANPLLLAGVPIVAAVILMGVYWLILRAGAV